MAPRRGHHAHAEPADAAPTAAAASARCCVPTGDCLRGGGAVTDARDSVRVLCNNEHCTAGALMHRECFEQWEAGVLTYLKSCGRARSWSERQRHQNLWTKKGYDLAFKACGCLCGRGHIKKDLDWGGEQQQEPGTTPPPPPPPAAPKKKKRRNRHNGAPRPSLVNSHHGGGGRGPEDPAAAAAAAAVARGRAGSMSSSNESSSSPPASSEQSISPARSCNRRTKSEFFSDRSRPGNGGNGIFARRQDFSSFNSLPRHKLNSYHIKVRVSCCREMEGKKRKGDKFKGMDYWKKWCGQAVSSKETHLATETTTSLRAAGNETVVASEPSTSVTESNDKVESVAPVTSVTVSNDEFESVVPAACLMGTTNQPTFIQEPTSLPVSSSSHPVAKLDVGFYSNQDEMMNEYIKVQILKVPWTPPKDYKFPISTKRNLRFQLKWIERFPWLSYSEYKSGAFCRICVVMGRSLEGKGSHQRIGQLVTEPFCKWKNALEIFETHAKTGYHKRNLELAENFLKVTSLQAFSVSEQLSSERKRQQEENRKKLIPIVKGIIFCGKQGIPLRGKIDSGRIVPEPDQPLQNDGNFRALLRYGAESGDKDLSEHLATSQKNALYTSPQIQNEIIDICGEIIQHKIIEEVKKARLFAILADETTDISRVEQVSLCLRYVDLKDVEHHKVKEMFLEYIPTVDVTGSGLANLIITALKKHGLECSHVVGQGYDGAAAMSGYLHGAQAYVRRECALALYVHCSAHSLNLAIADSCSQADIRNCVGIVQSVGSYFRHSAQRTAVLKDKIRELLPADHQKSLLVMCETRWVNKHEAVMRFKEIYPAIVNALEELQSSHNKETSQQAVQMLNTLRSSNFVMSLVILEKVMSYTLSLSKQLQTANTDLITAFSHVDDVINTLQLLRNKVDDEYPHIFEEAKVLLEENGGILQMPRIVGRQLNRSNIPASDTCSHYKINFFIPFLDHTIQQLNERFTKHRKVVTALSGILPSNFAASSEIEEAVCMYSSVLPERSTSVVKAELDVWKAVMTNTSPTPKSALECLDKCDQKLYPNVYTLLQILATIPVSTATPERTFSSLRRLKNYLRNTTSENRLNGLALMNIHYGAEIDADEVVDIFKMKNRRIIL